MSYVQDEEAVSAALARAVVSTGGALPEPPPMGTLMLPDGTYKDKVVAITGGGGGLGRGFAAEFARLGATVAILSRGAENRARGVAAVEAVGGRAVEAELDVRSPADIEAAFDNRRAHKHVVFPVRKAHHGVFEFVLMHLSVADAYPCIGHQPVQLFGHVVDALNSI